MKKIILITKKQVELFVPIVETFLNSPYNKGATAKERAESYTTIKSRSNGRDTELMENKKDSHRSLNGDYLTLMNQNKRGDAFMATPRLKCPVKFLE